MYKGIFYDLAVYLFRNMLNKNLSKIPILNSYS